MKLSKIKEDINKYFPLIVEYLEIESFEVLDEIINDSYTIRIKLPYGISKRGVELLIGHLNSIVFKHKGHVSNYNLYSENNIITINIAIKILLEEIENDI